MIFCLSKLQVHSSLLDDVRLSLLDLPEVN